MVEKLLSCFGKIKWNDKSTCQCVNKQGQNFTSVKGDISLSFKCDSYIAKTQAMQSDAHTSDQPES